ncbi:hypothetical protein SARC_09246 [Sphaeroforma arctica JP610]|uniref:Uncharacterized protein n=1 Tax=Sphaeroforma arctica JP610 TaxID=667725 RepID=A0A0L0FNF1_9EUKA|nr:hypothetical protein SARC_09246 [Sphaeroforma arctica JP610]KNC78322.1 hypothetical protein SARC_09246 [Sphaeroforma arctica JP610]|eukprot:XP_014152224.1 hypothetical protein SARC_09246 [Sphaeroforma arctica JP610]
MIQFGEIYDAFEQAQKKWRTKAKNTVAAATQEIFDVFEMEGTIKPSIPNLESAIKTLATLISPDNPKLKITYRGCRDNLSVALMTLRESLLRLWSLVKRGIKEIRLDGEREALEHAERMERMREVEHAYEERLRKVIGVDATDEN